MIPRCYLWVALPAKLPALPCLSAKLSPTPVLAICKRSRLNRQLDMELLLLLQNVLPMPTAERPEKKKKNLFSCKKTMTLSPYIPMNWLNSYRTRFPDNSLFIVVYVPWAGGRPPASGHFLVHWLSIQFIVSSVRHTQMHTHMHTCTPNTCVTYYT